MSKAYDRATRVLIVDDNEDLARVLGALLGMAGFEVSVAFSGGAALDVAPSFAPHVALIDLGLPDMDGGAVAEQLRASAGSEVHLVALTGLAFTLEHAKSAGFDELLRKPVTVAQVRAVLDRCGPVAS